MEYINKMSPAQICHLILLMFILKRFRINNEKKLLVQILKEYLDIECKNKLLIIFSATNIKITKN